MSSTIKFCKAVYRTIVPRALRQSAFVTTAKSKLLRHEWIYDERYFEGTIELAAAQSADAIADSITNTFKPTSVIDVGCGTGALLEALRNRGWQVFGLEYAEAALKFCRQRQLEVERFDLESDELTGKRTFDVATSMEVAEHLPESIADRYADLLSGCAPIIVFTAAHPGQGGADHVNEQPAAYWIAKFESRGFEHDKPLSDEWREAWQTGGRTADFYYQNLMIFRRK